MAHQATADLADDDILQLPGRQSLDMAQLRGLSRRADAGGALRIGLHLLTMAATGTLVFLARDRWAVFVPAMLLHGATIVTMFAPMHECVHKTAFKTPWLNNLVGWLAGALSFYNFNYYRRYHTWHHRYTQDPERDPELSDPKPHTLTDYVVHLSGIPFWLAKPRELMALALGRMSQHEYIPAHARREIAWSARAQLALYVAVAAASVATRSPLALWYWFLPAVLAQPLLRALLIVEHTGCSQDANGLTNTRTTLASWPIRFLMWNMPFHAEHHLYPSIPFFRLPAAHASLRQRFTHVAPSYPAANFEVIRTLGPAADHD
ncbi:MAG: fatty acid desaturase [Pirellulales bacterium]